MKKKPLKFKKMVFKRGKNLTVRKGDEWYNSIGDIVIQDSDDPENSFGGHIVQTTVLKFFSICDSDLGSHHDPRCRNMGGLYLMLQEYYPDFKADDVVTMIHFNIGKEESNKESILYV